MHWDRFVYVCLDGLRDDDVLSIASTKKTVFLPVSNGDKITALNQIRNIPGGVIINFQVPSVVPRSAVA